MGLLTSVNNLNYTLQEKENEKLRREKERIKAKEEKEEKEQIKNEITTYLLEQFTTFLLENGSNNIYYFYNINKKAELLNNIYNMHTLERINIMPKGKKYTSTYIQYKEFITIYFNNNYYKILKKAEDEQKKNEQYIYYNAILTQNTEKEEQQQQQQQVQYTQAKKQYNYNTIYTILKIIFYIICAPIAILVLILISACKNQK